MKREDFHIGQTVYLFHIRNHCREATVEERIIETKVVSIGRKYLTVAYWGRMEFDITKGFREKTIYSPSFELYLTKEDIYRAVETHNQSRVVFDRLRTSLDDIPLEGLQEILAIIEKYTE